MFDNVFLRKPNEKLFLLSIKIITKIPTPPVLPCFSCFRAEAVGVVFVKLMYQCFIRRGNSYKRSVIRVQNTCDSGGCGSFRLCLLDTCFWWPSALKWTLWWLNYSSLNQTAISFVHRANPAWSTVGVIIRMTLHNPVYEDKSTQRWFLFHKSYVMGSECGIKIYLLLNFQSNPKGSG